MTRASFIRPEAPGAACGVNEELIHDIVHAFYAKVRADDALGPIFEAAIDDWPAHLDRLCAFWSSVTLMTGAYKGDPLQAHVALPLIEDDHFRRWLALFRETVDGLATTEQRRVFMLRAERIADSLRFAIARAKGRIAEPLRACASGQGGVEAGQEDRAALRTPS